MEAVVSLVELRQAFYVADQFLERKVLFYLTIFTKTGKNLDFDKIQPQKIPLLPE